MPDRIEDIRRLQGCLNDLVGLLALPALWNGREPEEALRVLLDVLLRMLPLEFAYARLNAMGDGPALEICRVADRRDCPLPAQELGRALEPWFRLKTPGAVSVLASPLGTGNVALVYVWLGLDRERGVVAVGSRRADFPEELELLVLRSAVNQAVIELQRAEVFAARRQAMAMEQVKDHLLAENNYLRQVLDHEQQREIVGRSAALQKVLDLVAQVAPTDACVLIQGETGTGKELVARAVHRLSGRRQQPFVTLNCAAIPTGLLEAELFGHEKGAFTGAVGQRIGRFELAHRGTIFLDEVGEIPLELQAKLLRVLQEQEFERLGSARTLRVDVRLVAASNRNLARMVAEREFRSDLYYRLKVFPIALPPLRERSEDIPQLVRYFAGRHARRYGKGIAHIPEETLAALSRYSWPGNVREMENLIERSVILSPGPTLEVPLGELGCAEVAARDAATLEACEREHILRALHESRWVIAGPRGAAARLGMKRTSLQHRMRKLGIARPS
ncbi:MAG TPA: sigma 54-interacting transcriptional regulator [Methylococcaceae bacterium]|nr:sigma 54-interacting transcriptional regulator [Methylococcaceae bacterium]